MADEDVTEAEGTDTERLDRLERTQAEQGTKLDVILEKLSGALPTHAEAQQHEEKHLDRPTDMAERVQAEVAKIEAAKARQHADEEHKSEHARLAEEAARLREVPPAPPPRPALARMMTAGWHDR